MRFRLGEPPATEAFEPGRDGRWRPLDEPGLDGFKRRAEIGMLAAMPLLGAAWGWLFAHIGRAGGLSGLSLLKAALSLPLLFAAHELLHMLAHPGAGRHRDSVLGVLPGQGMLYAMYQGEMSRKHLLATLLAPFLGLTVVPWLVCLWRAEFSGYWAVLSFVNGCGATGDLLAVYLLLRGVPARGIVRNQGWRTWWRVPAA